MRWGLANFFPVFPQTAVLLISISQVARIIGMSYLPSLDVIFSMEMIDLC
jgi:hypothetical protein